MTFRRKIYHYIIFFLLLLGTHDSLANNEQIDSLKKILKEQSGTEERAQTLMDLGNLYYLYSNDTALLYYSQSYELAKRTTNFKIKAEISYRLGLVYQYMDPAKSAEYTLESVEYAEKTKDYRLIAYSRTMLGNLYRTNGELDKAMTEYKYALKVSETSYDSLQTARCYNNIGIVHMMKAEYDIGLEFWMQSLDLKLALGEELAAAATMSNIALYYKDIGRYFEAKEYLERALEINLATRDFESVSFCYTIIGDMHWRMGNHSEAVGAYETSLAYSDTIGSYFDKEDSYVGLSRVLDSLGRYKEALKYQRLYTQLVMDKNSEANSRITRELTTKFESEKKDELNQLLQSQNEAKDAQIVLEEENNRYLAIGLVLAFVMLTLIVFVLVRVGQAKREIEKQKHIVEEKNQEITDSISYAKRLQDAILPTPKTISAYLKQNFVFYVPKDIVAGDFYWLEPVPKKLAPNAVLFGVADCTGHGVPGAMVSVVCHNALNRAVREFDLIEPSKILDKVTDLVIETFATSNEEVRDGMDIALCLFDYDKKVVRFSGANNSLYHVSENVLSEIKPTKQPVGSYSNRSPFEEHEVKFKEGDMFYLFTDGFADQFGGDKGKKLKYKPFKDILMKNQGSSMTAQKMALTHSFVQWMGDYEQIDDVCIAGIKV